MPQPRAADADRGRPARPHPPAPRHPDARADPCRGGGIAVEQVAFGHVEGVEIGVGLRHPLGEAGI
ncbi:hypothetical protein, partial [Methylobacterium sp. WL116]|uniref:hypothetical protein n=1 Tax=Methylobacterium sp. WL116 TaxID=2603889 RepID=UPI001AEDF8AE